MHTHMHKHTQMSILGDKNQATMGDPEKGNGVAALLEMVLGK